MIAAIYARKSTDQSGVSEEEKSVARQIAHAKAYALRKGWNVEEKFVFVDDGISGAEFVKRPGFLRLMNALKPRPTFNILIMSEESRLGREQIETAYALKQIIDSGVRLFFYLEDRERTLDSAMEKVMLSLTNFAAEVERERARQRTYDALLRKARNGHVTGGKVYGYDNKAVTSSEGHRLHVVRVINEEQAAIVRRIFMLYADKEMGLTKIAKTLNGEGVAAPRHANGWAPSAIREMLYRPLYRGEIVWNELQKVERGGTKVRRQRAADQLIRVSAAELQIVSDELWSRTHARLKRAKEVFLRTNNGKLFGRPRMRDFESPYLLSGLARCGLCGGPIDALSRDYKRGKGGTYGCAYNRKRGSAVCQNSVRVDMDKLDHVLLQALSDVLDERVIEAAIAEALRRLRSGQQDGLTRRQAIERELSLIEAHEKNLAQAIARGENMTPLLVQLKEEENQKGRLVLELETIVKGKNLTEIDEARIKRELHQRVLDSKTLLSRHKPQARQVLRRLLDRPLVFAQLSEDGKPGYKVTGQGSLLKLLPDQLVTPCVVSPTGFEPVLPA